MEEKAKKIKAAIKWALSQEDQFDVITRAHEMVKDLISRADFRDMYFEAAGW